MWDALHPQEYEMKRYPEELTILDKPRYRAIPGKPVPRRNRKQKEALIMDVYVNTEMGRF